ncbi:hypothetical protein FOZ63_010728, partial [Perkinsus olseni]
GGDSLGWVVIVLTPRSLCSACFNHASTRTASSPQRKSCFYTGIKAGVQADLSRCLLLLPTPCPLQCPPSLQPRRGIRVRCIRQKHGHRSLLYLPSRVITGKCIRICGSPSGIRRSSVWVSYVIHHMVLQVNYRIRRYSEI